MSPLVTVVLLTFNGERYLEACLRAIESQNTPYDYDIVAIDSGSTDRSLDVLRAHPMVRLREIPNDEFGHGRTRNLGASMALGEFVVFLVQDAVPASETWLAEMIRPFLINDRVGCVYGRQLPRPDCCAAVKYDVRSFFGQLGDATSLRLDARTTGDGPPADESRASFFSDVNSAVRLSAWREVPFRDVPFAEDQALARDLMEAGWWKIYTPFAAVHHSHDLRLLPYYARMREEWTALRHLGVEPYHGFPRFVLASFRIAARNVLETVRDSEYSWERKLREIALAPVYSFARHLAILTSRRSTGRPAASPRS